MKITLAIITLNEDQNLPRCLASAAPLSDEILILDSGSEDRTSAVAAEYGARFIHQPWLGYVGQKNKLLSLATHEWILSLDADEALSSELAEEIRSIKAAGSSEDFSGYRMPRCVCYEGKWIRHGDWYPDRLVRLFLRDRATFTGARVHERLDLRGSVCDLSGEIQHYSFKNAADHRTRCQKYAHLWAESQFELGHRAAPGSPWFHAGFRFLRGYFLRRGFLDGALGFRIASYSSREVFLKYKLLRELQQQPRS